MAVSRGHRPWRRGRPGPGGVAPGPGGLDGRCCSPAPDTASLVVSPPALAPGTPRHTCFAPFTGPARHKPPRRSHIQQAATHDAAPVPKLSGVSTVPSEHAGAGARSELAFRQSALSASAKRIPCAPAPQDPQNEMQCPCPALGCDARRSSMRLYGFYRGWLRSWLGSKPAPSLSAPPSPGCDIVARKALSGARRPMGSPLPCQPERAATPCRIEQTRWSRSCTADHACVLGPNGPVNRPGRLSAAEGDAARLLGVSGARRCCTGLLSSPRGLARPAGLARLYLVAPWRGAG